MSWTILATILGTLASSILKSIWARQDVTDAVKYKLLTQLAEVNERAGLWKAAAWADPARAAALGVLPSAQGLRPLSPDYPSSGRTSDPPVPPGS